MKRSHFVFSEKAHSPAILILLLLALLTVAACGGDDREHDPTEDYLPDSINTDGMAGIVLGDPIVELSVALLDADSLTDSLENENGFIWVVRTFHTPGGVVIAEGDFIDERQDDLEYQLSRSMINRIRVESGGFVTRHGLRVGDGVQKLSECADADSLEYIPDPRYGTLSVRVADDSRVYYLFRGLEELVADTLVSSLDELPRDQKISAIVMM